ncbi:methyl-accepting chemotaxis protein [Paraburkholderia phosphatilytica]|uniref:methyl-accepting chemotaxis protein n=1 Tax=Paraburkholderia phosphatilytica TaxID=2282883 RepID=UPI001F0BE975|nr:methyl-accepting chemotaxis protein [Paraburkholderia phosphatilytica]
MHSIRFKIFATFGASVTLLVIVGIFGVLGLSSVNSNMRDSFTGNTGPIADLSDVRSAQLDIRLRLHLIEMFRDAGRTKSGIEQIRADQKAMDAAWKHYYASGVTTSKERTIAGQIKKLLPQFNDLTEQLITELSAGSYFGAIPMVDSHEEIAGALATLVDQDAALHKAQAAVFEADSDVTFHTFLVMSIALVGVGVLAAIGLSLYLSHVVTAPLDQAVWVANRIAGGTLRNPFDVKISRDEFGQLLQALKSMDQQLSETVSDIKASAESVDVTAREISTGNLDLSARTEEQAASLEETAASMTQLTETVRQNADNAQQASVYAGRASDMASTGNGAMQGMMKTIESISGSSTRISEITGVIEGIAFQTNILALNAAVEAARAGEQGRGFAVVASEVRSLAQRSATAAREIKELLESSVATIQVGVTQAAEVGNIIEEVMRSIGQVSGIVVDIATASSEQSRGIEQIHQAVVQMDEVTQQNAALVEQAAAAAQSLQDQTVNLNRAVAVFRIADAAEVPREGYLVN